MVYLEDLFFWGGDIALVLHKCMKAACIRPHSPMHLCELETPLASYLPGVLSGECKAVAWEQHGNKRTSPPPPVLKIPGPIILHAGFTSSCLFWELFLPWKSCPCLLQLGFPHYFHYCCFGKEGTSLDKGTI